jgi:hypothetical protein
MAWLSTVLSNIWCIRKQVRVDKSIASPPSLIGFLPLIEGGIGGPPTRVFNTVIPQANFVNNCSFWVQNCKYRVPQDFQYRNTAIFQGKYRNTVRKIS